MPPGSSDWPLSFMLRVQFIYDQKCRLNVEGKKVMSMHCEKPLTF